MSLRDRETQPLVQSLALIPPDTPLVRISTLWQRQALFFGGLMAEVKMLLKVARTCHDVDVEEPPSSFSKLLHHDHWLNVLG
ncbi:unnamed protein product [Cochlearia groenlandica]